MAPIEHALFPRVQLRSLIQGVLAPQPRDFSLIGARFMGKTRVLNELAAPDGPLWKDAVERPQPLDGAATIAAVYYDCEWPDARGDLLAFLADYLVHHLRQNDICPDLDLDQIAQQPPLDRLRLLIDGLTARGVRLVLLLDNFDTLIADADPQTARRIDQLRPLARDLAWIVTSERPLHEVNRSLASSLLFNLLNQIFLRLIEPQETETILHEFVTSCADRAVLVKKLAAWTGGHPFLLSRIEEILLDVGAMLPAQQEVGAAHLPLIRLRLTEEYGRLLFDELWDELQDPADETAAEALAVVRRLLTGTISLSELQKQHPAACYWLLNKGILRIEGETCHIFSTLFRSYLLERLAPGVQRANVAVRDARVLVEDQAQPFTPQERTLLRYFLDRPGEVISIEELLADVWKRPHASARRVQEGIRRLRNRMDKLEFSMGTIENEWGEGYKYVPVNGSRR